MFCVAAWVWFFLYTEFVDAHYFVGLLSTDETLARLQRAAFAMRSCLRHVP